MRDDSLATTPSLPVPAPLPAIAGPDYVAVVIEWTDEADTARTPRPARAPAWSRVATAVGALGALVLARWGVRRLRHAFA